VSRYGDTLYFLIITASTVGYGDFYPVTDLGKLFMSLYLTGSQHIPPLPRSSSFSASYIQYSRYLTGNLQYFRLLVTYRLSCNKHTASSITPQVTYPTSTFLNCTDGLTPAYLCTSLEAYLSFFITLVT
jgi:hypothetical protein